MGRTSASVKNRYNAKVYDRVALLVPKGRKQTLEAAASAKGESLNGFINRILRSELGIGEAEWKRERPEGD